MNPKYLNLLRNVKELPLDQAHEVCDSLCEDLMFLKELKTYKDFTWDEHDGLEHMLNFKKKFGNYHDKYSKKVSYNGIATLKSPGTEMSLNIIHEIEIKKVQDDYEYFKRLYSKIPTRNGVSRGDARPYQLKLDKAFMTGEDLAVSFSRQRTSW